MAKKNCTKCNIEKDITQFSHDKKNKKDGHTNICKSCVHEYYLENKEKMNRQSMERYYSLTDDQMKQIRVKAYDRYLNNKDWHSEYYKNNKEKWKKYNTEEKKEYNRKWREDNRAHIKEYNKSILSKKRSIHKNKMLTNPKYRIDRAMSTGIRRVNTKKNGRKWQSLVGFTNDDLYRHLESLFTDGMSWENFGEWHIDHVVPLSWFSYESVEDEEFRKAWALENLQPLWAKDNLMKGNLFAGGVK